MPCPSQPRCSDYPDKSVHITKLLSTLFSNTLSPHSSRNVTHQVPKHAHRTTGSVSVTVLQYSCVQFWRQHVDTALTHWCHFNANILPQSDAFRGCSLDTRTHTHTHFPTDQQPKDPDRGGGTLKFIPFLFDGPMTSLYNEQIINRLVN
jgi:hypothetical protein